MDRLRILLSFCRVFPKQKENDCERQAGQGTALHSSEDLLPNSVEDYRPGYPRFSALIAAYAPFHACRRFSIIRARLLLLKQDKLSALEKQLEKVDRDEPCDLFLASARCDQNQERKALLSQIDIALADYDAFVERTQRILRLEPARQRDRLSLQNWVHGNSCLARDEVAYLKHFDDLLSLSSSDDNAVMQLQGWVEDNMVRFYRCFDKRPFPDLSRDSNVYIFSGKSTMKNVASRTAVIVIATVIFITALSGLTRARSVELFVAGSTYATVLVVFVSTQS